MTITEFLLARITEDEAVAQAAKSRARWRQDGYAVVLADNGMWIAEAQEDSEDAAHIARHDPDRVLAECTAKRLMIGRLACPDAPTCGDPDCQVVFEDWQILATVYGEHPDFDQEWHI